MKIRLYLSILSLFLTPGLCRAGEGANLPSAGDVVERMLRSDAQRQRSLSGYEGARRYVLVNDHMRKRAEMVVRVTGDPDGTKHFEIVSETGWKAAQKHVLRKMLQSEEEASRPGARSKARLSLDNYEFQMVGMDELDGRTVYTIDVSPKRKEKYLFRGRIWVDAEDYALVQADGHPAENPSFWTKSVHFTHTYQKSGTFWFPSTTDSLTEARIFGATALKIEYFDYKPGTSAVAGNGSELAQQGSKL
jgi:hypothetical protein